VIEQLHADVYVETGYEAVNVGGVRTGDGLILIDTPIRFRDARIWRARLTQLTRQEVRYIINTSYDPSHMLGNHFFAPVPAIAHQAAWDQIKSWGDTQLQRLLEGLREGCPEGMDADKEFHLIPPRVTFTDRMVLHYGDKRLQLMHLGGYSPGAIGVYLPEVEIFFSGDVVINGQHPSMEGAHTAQWLRALTEIRRLRIKAIVPSHGPPCTKEDTQQLSAYIRLLRRRVRSHMRAHQGRREVVEGIGIDEFFAFFPFPATARPAVEKRIRASLRQVYDELRTAGNEEVW